MTPIRSPLPRATAGDRSRRTLLALARHLAPLALAAWVAVSTGGGFPR